MEVDEDRIGAVLQLAAVISRVDGAERTIELGHEDAAHGVDDEHIRAVASPRTDAAPLPGVPFGKLSGRISRVLALDEHQRLLLIESMVAERDRVGAGVEDLLGDRFRDAEAAGRVLAVDDDEVEIVALAQPRQRFQDGLAARSVRRRHQETEISFKVR